MDFRIRGLFQQDVNHPYESPLAHNNDDVSVKKMSNMQQAIIKSIAQARVSFPSQRKYRYGAHDFADAVRLLNSMDYSEEVKTVSTVLVDCFRQSSAELYYRTYERSMCEMIFRSDLERFNESISVRLSRDNWNKQGYAIISDDQINRFLRLGLKPEQPISPLVVNLLSKLKQLGFDVLSGRSDNTTKSLFLRKEKARADTISITLRPSGL